MRTQGTVRARAKKSVDGFYDVSACITVCIECADACTTCADACLNEAKVQKLARCIWSDIDCADICHTTARILARQTEISPELLRAQLETTITATGICAQECEKLFEMHPCCRTCARICRNCEQICRQMLANLPYEDGFTSFKQEAYQN
ncbi:MAG TPA: four-helix bundle copper-binding protein [Desulfuromonadaceae bacterium]